MIPKFNKLLLVSLSSPHLKTFYELVSPLFKEVVLVSNEKQDYCKTITLDFRLSNPINALKNIKLLSNFIEEYNPDVVHVHQANSVAVVTGIALKKRKPLIVTAWGSDVLVLPKENWIKKKIAKKALSFASLVTADASFMKPIIKELGAKSEIVIANFGIELNNEELVDLAKSKKSIIYSNRLHHDLYRIDQIIEGFSNFQKTNEEWKLVIAGNGTLTNQLKKRAKEILSPNSYEFVGFINKEENFNFYKQAKIWISNPVSDGTAVSLLEAMHFGCIPVVSDLPANKEWISEDLKNGVIISNDVSMGLNNASKLDWEFVSNTNKKLIKERASKDSMMDVFMDCYNNLIN